MGSTSKVLGRAMAERVLVEGLVEPVRKRGDRRRERGRGRVVLVGSLAGRAPIPFQSHYSSTKAAIDALALSLRNEVGPLGLGVSLIVLFLVTYLPSDVVLVLSRLVER